MYDMSMIFFLSALGILLLAVAFVATHLRKDKSKVHCSGFECRLDDEPAGSASKEQDELYRMAMDPCSCGKPVMYTLHTCLHCRHLKDFLTAHGVDFEMIYVDDFEGEKRREAMDMVRRFNPRGSFPTLVLPDGRVSIGFRREQVTEMLGLKK